MICSLLPPPHITFDIDWWVILDVPSVPHRLAKVPISPPFIRGENLTSKKRLISHANDQKSDIDVRNYVFSKNSMSFRLQVTLFKSMWHPSDRAEKLTFSQLWNTFSQWVFIQCNPFYGHLIEQAGSSDMNNKNIENYQYFHFFNGLRKCFLPSKTSLFRLDILVRDESSLKQLFCRCDKRKELVSWK